MPNSAVLSELPRSVHFTMVTVAYNEEKSQALMRSAYGGDQAAVEHLLWSYANPNHEGDRGQTPIFVASDGWRAFGDRSDSLRSRGCERSRAGGWYDSFVYCIA
eukprot:gnl/TRDRNA2_/TRDRNA2_177805_c10_seq10.p1 gnl/TRDRNA2_/TRDRNA2_177805_c10~~gnl/TRDRNA2_/TRDRNA2_177805_c10_seq10.p1  ORF type:complete len:104 (+),score=9.42 gnl/TRDRNA2_/TRDRNA2_177805_c10_seq10:332-643(+)